MADLAKRDNRILSRTLLGVIAATVGAYVVGVSAAGLLVIAGLPRLPLWATILLGEALVTGSFLTIIRGSFRPPTEENKLIFWKVTTRFVMFTIAYEGFTGYYGGGRTSVAGGLVWGLTLSLSRFFVDWIGSQMDQGADGSASPKRSA